MTRLTLLMAAGGAALYLIVLLLTLPAGVVVPRLVAATPVAVGGLEGTLWRGSAAIVVIDGFPVYGLHWQVQPLALFRGRLEGRLEGRLQDGFLSARVAYSPLGGSLHVEDGQVATRLAPLATPAGFAGVDGNLSLQLEYLVIQAGWPLYLSARLGVGNLSVQELGRQPLGDFEGIFRLEGEDVTGELRDGSGLLKLEAFLRVDRALRWDLQGEVAPRQDAPTALNDAMTLLGPPDEHGHRPFGLGGRL